MNSNGNNNPSYGALFIIIGLIIACISSIFLLIAGIQNSIKQIFVVPSNVPNFQVYYYYYLIAATIGLSFVLTWSGFNFPLPLSDLLENKKTPRILKLLGGIVFIALFLLIGIIIFSVIPLKVEINLAVLSNANFLEYSDTGLGIMTVYFFIFIVISLLVEYIYDVSMKFFGEVDKWTGGKLYKTNEITGSKDLRQDAYMIPIYFLGAILTSFALYLIFILPFILSICFAGPFLSGNTSAYCPANSNTFFYSVFSLFNNIPQVRNINPATSPIRISYIYLNINNMLNPMVAKIILLGSLYAGLEALYKISKWFSKTSKTPDTP